MGEQVAWRVWELLRERYVHRELFPRIAKVAGDDGVY
jgi:hypothetical protein